MLESRIAEIEGKLRADISKMLAKEKSRRLPRLNYWFRGLMGYNRPHADEYVSFENLVEERDKLLIQDALRNYKENNQWFSETFPNFEDWIAQKYFDEDYLGELHEAVTGPWRLYESTYRKGNIQVLGSPIITPSPEKIPELIDRLNYVERANHSVERAAEIHYNFVNIHPYNEANGRVSRLLMNLSLIEAGSPPLKIEKENEREHDLYNESLAISSWLRNPKYFADFVTLKTMRTLSEMN